MRAIRAASAALLATAVVCLAAPTASADDGLESDGLGSAVMGSDGLGSDGLGSAVMGSEVSGSDGTGSNITSFGFSVSPSTVAPGGTVTLKSDGCEVPTVTVSSGVFVTVTLKEGHPGTATVDADAKVGAEYQVTFECEGEKGTTPLTIAGHSTGGHSTAGHSTGGQSTGGHDTGAHKGVKAGFGGGAGQLGTAEVVIGTTLIAGALGGGVLLMRRRGTEDHA